MRQWITLSDLWMLLYNMVLLTWWYSSQQWPLCMWSLPLWAGLNIDGGGGQFMCDQIRSKQSWANLGHVPSALELCWLVCGCVHKCTVRRAHLNHRESGRIKARGQCSHSPSSPLHICLHSWPCLDVPHLPAVSKSLTGENVGLGGIREG